MNFSFLVDNAQREVLINTYVGELLNRSLGYSYGQDDYDFFYSRRGYDFMDRTKGSSDILLYPSYNVLRTPEQMSRAVRLGAKMVATHAEQIFNKALYEEKLNTKSKKSYNRHISAHLVWGSFFANMLRKHTEIPSDKIWITGNPKLEISRKIDQHRSQVDGKKRVLVVSDFTLADMNNADWADFKIRYKAKFSTPLNEVYQQARSKSLAWVREAALRFSNVLFSFRIHPGEDISAYNELLGINNVEIVGDASFVDDIVRSDIIYSFTSTSIFEVLTLDKPNYNMKLVDIPEERTAEYFKIFEWHSQEQFFEKIADLDSGKVENITATRKEQVEEFMYDGHNNSLLRTAIAMHEILGYSQTRYNWKDYYSNYANASLALLKDRIVKLGVFANDQLGISNWVNSFASQRAKQEESNPTNLDQKFIDQAKLTVNDLLTEDEFRVLKTRSYKIRKEENGNYIDF